MEVDPGSWPVLSSESVPWHRELVGDRAPRRARISHSGPYSAAITPDIAGRSLALPSATAALAEEASNAIARFDAELGSEIAPFASILLRTESASSSRIENLTSGARAIAVAELGGTAKHNATEIVGNVRAMQAAVDLADQLDAAAVLDMHRALMGKVMPGIAGKWRDEPVWIGGSNYGPHGADFIPPRAERIPSAMSDLMAFAQREDLQVLPQAAVAHAQFETIHPFPDGNGRTGRALLHAMLRSKGLTRNVTVPVSAGLLTAPTTYFDALTAYRQGHVEVIVDVLAHAVFAAIGNGRTLVADIHAVRAGWNSRIHVRRGAAAWRLADLLLQQPVFVADTVAALLHVTPPTAYGAIDALASAGIITEFTGGKRNRMWQAPQVLAALDRFAERAGRRA